MSWLTAESDLRTRLSDNSEDKFAFRKKCFGDCNSVNTSFKTLEFRRLTPLDSAAAPLGVYVNGVSTPASADFPTTGDFALGTAPANGDLVEASYYYQWFTDIEIDQFLRLSTNWLNLGDDWTTLPSGLHPSCLEYSLGEAYEKLALRWSQRLSEQYLLQDAIDKDRPSLADTYMKWSMNFKKNAAVLRNDYYSRAGQNETPASGVISGSVREVVPSR